MKVKSMIAVGAAAMVLGGCSMTDTLVKDWDKVEAKVKPLVHLMESNKEPTPDLKPLKDVRWASQNWTYEQQEWFWHIPQGTIIMPYEWFISLEQPKNDGKGLFTERSYMARFGFIPSKKSKNNPDGLPVGFVKDEKFKDPMNGSVSTVAGITCAACHTGEINYKGKGLLIDGGAALIDVTLFQDKLAVSLAETLLLDNRFKRFAKRVLKENYSEQNAYDLKKMVEGYVKKSSKYSNAMIVNDLNQVKEGFGRVDALTRIGNVVFGAQLDLENIRPISAPVSYPPIWDVPWFDWAQYNGSIRQPMVRNVGEALGVQAIVNLADPKRLFDSSVHVGNLHKIEELLAGDKPFSGLQSPKWPEDILGKIDHKKAAKGEELYNKHCISCHLPPVGSSELMKDKYWEKPNIHGKKYLKTHNIPLSKIGTDGAEVTDFYNRRALAYPLVKDKNGTLDANVGLKVVTEAVANKWYDEHNISPEKRIEMDGYRENKVLRPLKYRARPLNGIWSTPPFLHNGSVLNMYELLSPLEKRSTKFFVGTKEFDPVKLGYQNKDFKGAFLMDTTIQGNGNSGHLFDDGKGEGIIGPKLQEIEKMQIIEYLKTL